MEIDCIVSKKEDDKKAHERQIVSAVYNPSVDGWIQKTYTFAPCSSCKLPTGSSMPLVVSCHLEEKNATSSSTGLSFVSKTPSKPKLLSAICVDNTGVEFELINGIEYEIVKKEEKLLLIRNENGDKKEYLAERFSSERKT